MNLMYDFYEKVDNTVMKCVNAGVHAYNWTTGKTKEDLAKKLIITAPILESAGLPNWGKFGGFMIFVGIVNSISDYKKNKKVGELEKKAAESECKSLESENLKKECEIWGPVYLFTGGVISGHRNHAMGTFTNEDYTNPFIGLGMLIRGASHYVMRADYLPPRKSAIREGIEKLQEIVEEYTPRPLPVPVPVPVSVN